MPTHLDYVAVRQRQNEIARQAERVRQERDGRSLEPASPERSFPGRLFTRLRLRRPANAPASSR